MQANESLVCLMRSSVEIVNCLPVYKYDKAKVVTAKKRKVLMQGLFGVRKIITQDKGEDLHNSIKLLKKALARLILVYYERQIK